MFQLTGYVRKSDGERTRRRVCKKCAAQKTREWAKRNPGARAGASRAWRIKNRFKAALSVALRNGAKCSLDEITEAFTGSCSICLKPESECSTLLHLVHDHETGKFRGWLCCQCNLGLGMFGDSPAMLHEAAEYLARRTKC
jgi:hypothetical protein